MIDALEAIRQAAIEGDALMPRYVEAAKVGATLGEMMGVLTGVFRVYQHKNLLATIYGRIMANKTRIRVLLAKPGLDGHD